MSKILGQVSQDSSHDVNQFGSRVRLLFPAQLVIVRVQFLGSVEFTLALTLKLVGHTSQMLYLFLKAPLNRSGPPG